MTLWLHFYWSWTCLTAQLTTLSWPQAALQGCQLKTAMTIHGSVCTVCVEGGDRGVCRVLKVHENILCVHQHTDMPLCAVIMCVFVYHGICSKASFRACKSLFYQESSCLWLSCSSPAGHWQPDSEKGQQLVLKFSNFVKLWPMFCMNQFKKKH